MTQHLTIALIQTDLVWENPEQNRLRFTEKINSIPDAVDLIVLPEMFTSGFTMNAETVAETMGGNTIVWLQRLAKDRNAAITGSIVIKEDGDFYNRLLFVRPNGHVERYDKRHTFTLAGEHKVYKAGEEKVIIEYLGWYICPLICYDLRFPVWARNIEGYDLLLYVANWPKPRINAWDTLLRARAIENMSYCIGVNRIGLDATGHAYSGHSAVYDVLGRQLGAIPKGKEAIEIVTLEKNHIQKYREKLGFLDDMDRFNLEV